jgi:hypothetical protein
MYPNEMIKINGRTINPYMEKRQFQGFKYPCRATKRMEVIHGPKKG